MTTTPNHLPGNRQGGAAALLLLLLLLLSLVTVLTLRLDRRQPEQEAQRRTAAALAEAKAALLGWSVLDTGGAVVNPGRLPCPDQNDDGGSEGSACAAPFVGRLPWKTLGIPDRRDAAGEVLWYVVDAAFRSGGGALNSTLVPTLTLNGTPVVAALIAPGPPLSTLGQVRGSAGSPPPSNLYSNYLEAFTPPASLAGAAPSATYNDEIRALTAAEVFTLVTARVAAELAAANPGAPYAAATIGDLVKPPVWTDNGWDSAVDGAQSSVTPTLVTLKFVNCAIVYKITGPGNITRSANSC